jgi:hypothetical protein
VHERSYLTSVDSCFRWWVGQCMKRTKQRTTCDITVRHATCTVAGCGFVVKYQNTSNLENQYVTTGTDHKKLADRLTSIHHIDRQERLGSVWAFRMRARCSCKAPSILHPILWYLSFIRWSGVFKGPRSRTFTPHRGRLFPYVKHLRKLSCQRRCNSFWRPGHRWWRSSVNISI